MKNLRTPALLAAMALALFFPAMSPADITTRPSAFSASDSIITFETGSTALPSIPGVQFVDNFNGTTGFAGDASFATDLFGSQAYGNLVSSTYSDLAITFSTPQPAVGAYVGKIQNFTNKSASSLLVRVFDASNDLLDSTTVTLNPVIGGKPISFVGFGEFQGISRIEWIGGNTGFFGVDNVTIGTLVPEPASLAILAAGGLLLTRRRSR